MSDGLRPSDGYRRKKADLKPTPKFSKMERLQARSGWMMDGGRIHPPPTLRLEVGVFCYVWIKRYFLFECGIVRRTTRRRCLWRHQITLFLKALCLNFFEGCGVEIQATCMDSMRRTAI